jgi:hypothetical protein
VTASINSEHAVGAPCYIYRLETVRLSDCDNVMVRAFGGSSLTYRMRALYTFCKRVLNTFIKNRINEIAVICVTMSALIIGE